MRGAYRRACLRADQHPLFIRPEPFLLTLLARHICPQNSCYYGFVEVNDKNDKNEWKGLDIDLYRAPTTVILGDPDANQIVPLSWAQRFPALQSGDVDVIIKAIGWTMGRDTELGLHFSLPYFFGGTQFMAHGDLGITDATGLKGGVICLKRAQQLNGWPRTI